jgi:hypothetical protein
MNKKFILLLAFALNTALLFSASPQLVWHQVYGSPQDSQQVFVSAIDNYDNMFLAGAVYFSNSGSLIINRYDGVGVLMWNRLYSNNPPAGTVDKAVALFPDDQAGVRVIAAINTNAVLTHFLYYDGSGTLQSDLAVGDTAAGNKTIPLTVITDGVSYYMLGQLNNVSSVFKCDYSGHILWSAPVNDNYNSQAGNISFDPFGNIVAAVYDSILPQVIIHRYNSNTGLELPGFNSHISSLPVNGNFIQMQVDPGSNVFMASTGTDSLGRTQLAVNKFDTSGNILWSTLCTSGKGHTNMLNSFVMDHNGDILISGPYTDNTDTLQYAGLYKVFNPTGGILWSFADSEFLVNSAVTVVDQFDNVYLGDTKTPSTISPNYSTFSFTRLTSDSGQVQWNRSFDNSSDNFGLMVQVNNFGDLFFATNTPTDSNTSWFAGRIGNNAGDSLGTSVQTIAPTLSLNVFPNPFSSETNISFTSSQAEQLSLTIFDISGQLVQQQQVQSVAGYNQLAVKAEFAPGLYLIQLEGKYDFAVQRVIIAP